MMDLEKFTRTATAAEAIKHFCYQEREKACKADNPGTGTMTVQESYLIAKLAESLGELVSGSFTDSDAWSVLCSWAELGQDFALTETRRPFSPTPQQPSYPEEVK